MKAITASDSGQPSRNTFCVVFHFHAGFRLFRRSHKVGRERLLRQPPESEVGESLLRQPPESEFRHPEHPTEQNPPFAIFTQIAHFPTAVTTGEGVQRYLQPFS